MFRLVVLAAIVVLGLVAAQQVLRSVRARRVDWRGVAFMAGFVALAFFLREVTGIE